eukprot:Hpha_TRINITY_DN7480_c0_g1::TRINITY_DN7480_c0_g1_i1::g.95735::m.95735
MPALQRASMQAVSPPPEDASPAQTVPTWFYTSLGGDSSVMGPQWGSGMPVADESGRPLQSRTLNIPVQPPPPSLASRALAAAERRATQRLWSSEITALGLDDLQEDLAAPEWISDATVRACVLSFLSSGALTRSMRRVCSLLMKESERLLRERRTRVVPLSGQGRRLKYRDGYAVVRYHDGSAYEGRHTAEEGRHGRGVMWYRSNWHPDCDWGRTSPELWPASLSYVEGEWSADGLQWGTVALLSGDRCRVAQVCGVPGKSELQDVTVTYQLSHLNAVNPSPVSGPLCSSVSGTVRQRCAAPRPRGDSKGATDVACRFDLRKWVHISPDLPAECDLSVFVDGWCTPAGSIRVRNDILLMDLRKLIYQRGILALPPSWVFRVFDAAGEKRYREDRIKLTQALPPNRVAFLSQRLRRPWSHSVFGWPGGTRVHNAYALCVIVVPANEEAAEGLAECINTVAQTVTDTAPARVATLLKQNEEKRQEAKQNGIDSAAAALERSKKEEEADNDADPLLPEVQAPPLRHRKCGFGRRERARAASGCGVICARASDPSPLGLTALHVAAEGGRRDAVVMLLAEGANSGAQDWQGRVALHYAASRGSATCVAVLLGDDEGLAQIDIQSTSGATPLHEALYAGYLNTALWLVEQGARVDIADVQGNTARQLGAAVLPSLLDYATKGDLQHVASVIHALRWGREPWLERPSTRLPVPEEPLPGLPEPEADTVYAEWLRLRLTQGGVAAGLIGQVSVGRSGQRVRNVLGWTALHAAAAGGHHAVCHQLLACPLVDIDAKDSSGRTALHHAAAGGHLSTVHVLIRLQASRAPRDNRGRTPLHLAVQRRRIEVISLLLKVMSSVAVGATDEAGAAALHYCIAGGELLCRAVLQPLLELSGGAMTGYSPVQGALQAAAARRVARLRRRQEQGIDEHCDRMERVRETRPVSSPLDLLLSSSPTLRARYGAPLQQGRVEVTRAFVYPLGLVETAVRACNTFALAVLIHEGHASSLQASDGRPLLEIASHCACKEIVSALIDCDAPLDEPSSQIVRVDDDLFRLGVGLSIALDTSDADLQVAVLRHPSFLLEEQVVAVEGCATANPLTVIAAVHKTRWPFVWRGQLSRYAAEIRAEVQRLEGGDDVCSMPSVRSFNRSASPASPGSMRSKGSPGSMRLKKGQPLVTQPVPPVQPEKPPFEPEVLKRPAFTLGGLVPASWLSQSAASVGPPISPGSRSLSPGFSAGPKKEAVRGDTGPSHAQWILDSETAFLAGVEAVLTCAIVACPEGLRDWAGHALSRALHSRRLFAAYAAACQGVAEPVLARQVLAEVPCDWSCLHPAGNTLPAATTASPTRRRSQSFAMRPSCSLHPLALNLMYLEPQLSRLLELAGTKELDELVQGLCRRRLFSVAGSAADGAAKDCARVRPFVDCERKLWASALHLVALHSTATGALGCASSLCRGGGFDVSQESGEGLQALHYASMSGNSQMVQFLLDRQADADAVATRYESNQCPDMHLYDFTDRAGAVHSEPDLCVSAKGTTPLHLAAKRGHQGVVQILLNAGVRVDRKNKNDWTALMWAARYGHQRVCQVLLDAGADRRRVNKLGDSALLIAAANGHSGAASCLMQGQDMWRQCNPYNGHTIGHYAAARQCMPLLEQVLLKVRSAGSKGGAASQQPKPPPPAPGIISKPNHAFSADNPPPHRCVGRALPLIQRRLADAAESSTQEGRTATEPDKADSSAAEGASAAPSEVDQMAGWWGNNLLPSLVAATKAVNDSLAPSERTSAFPIMRKLCGTFSDALAPDEGAGDPGDVAGEGLLNTCGTAAALLGLMPPPGESRPTMAPRGGLQLLGLALARVDPRSATLAMHEQQAGRQAEEQEEEAAASQEVPKVQFQSLQGVFAAAHRRAEILGDDEKYPALSRVSRELQKRLVEKDGTSPLDGLLEPFVPEADVCVAGNYPLVATTVSPLPPLQPIHYAVALGRNQAAQLLRPLGDPAAVSLFQGEDGRASGRVAVADPDSDPLKVRGRSVMGLPPVKTAGLYSEEHIARLPDLSPELRKLAITAVEHALPPPDTPLETVRVWHPNYSYKIFRALTSAAPFDPAGWGQGDEPLDLRQWFDAVHGARCFYAVRRGFVDLLRGGVHLISDANVLSDQRTTLMMTAAWYGHESIIHELIHVGARPGYGVKLHPAEESCPGKLSPVILAISRGAKAAATALLDAGADAESCDENGNTLSHYAVHRGEFETLKMLLHRDAPIDLPNHMQEIPLQIAMAKRHSKMVRLLDAWQSVINVGRDEPHNSGASQASPGVLSQRDMARWYLRANNAYQRYDRMLSPLTSINCSEVDSVPCILYAKICRNGGDPPSRAMQQQLKYYFWPDEVRELDAGGGVQLGPQGLTNVLELMMVLPNVEMLDLSGNRLEHEHVQNLCKKAQQHPSLRRIRMNNTRSIGRRAGGELERLLTKTPRIVEVECQNTQIDAPLLARLHALGAENKRKNARFFATDVKDASLAQSSPPGGLPPVIQHKAPPHGEFIITADYSASAPGPRPGSGGYRPRTADAGRKTRPQATRYSI